MSNHTRDAFFERMLWAFFRWQASQRPVRQVTHEELGVLVGKELGRGPIPQSTVSRWFTEYQPSRATMPAIAKVFGVPVGWLEHGEGSPPDVVGPPTPLDRPRR